MGSYQNAKQIQMLYEFDKLSANIDIKMKTE